MAFKKEELIIIEPRDIIVGDKKAPVTLMEFGEYENEACAKANEVVKEIMEKMEGVVKFNFRHFPQTKIHQRSLKASESAVAAGQEGKFWQMHNILFANRRNLGTTSLKLHSREAGVHNKHFLDNLVNATFGWQVQADMKEAINMGIKTIPAFYINDEPYKGKINFDEMKKAILDAAKKAKKKTPTKKERA